MLILYKNVRFVLFTKTSNVSVASDDAPLNDVFTNSCFVFVCGTLPLFCYSNSFSFSLKWDILIDIVHVEDQYH